MTHTPSVCSVQTKRVRKHIIPSLNVMVAGRTFVGKTSFLRTLINALDIHIPSSTFLSSFKELSTENHQIVTYPPVQVLMEHNRVSLTLIDTPGLAEDGKALEACIEYIETQLEEYLQEERKVNRNPLTADKMVHLVLYLLPPGPLSDLDLSAMKRFQTRSNVLPILSRTDTLTEKQRTHIRDQLQSSLRSIPTLKFLDTIPTEYTESDSTFEDELKAIQQRLPFSMVSAEFDDKDPFLRSRDKPLVREYAWGKLQIEFEGHCDLSWIKYILFDLGLESLRTSVRIDLYEQFRTERLSSQK